MISWNSHGYFTQTGSTSANYYDRRMSRFKCRVRDETTLQIVAASTRTTPNMQVCNWTGVAGHQYRMEIKPLEWDPGLESEEVGWAFVH